MVNIQKKCQADKGFLCRYFIDLNTDINIIFGGTLPVSVDSEDGGLRSYHIDSLVLIQIPKLSKGEASEYLDR